MNVKQIPDFAESTVDGLNKHTHTHTQCRNRSTFSGSVGSYVSTVLI